MTAAALIERQRRALAKAQRLGTHRTVERFTVTDYAVRGERGAWRFVTVTARGYACTCEAGRQGAPCYHAAGVHLYRAGEQAFGREPIPARAGR